MKKNLIVLIALFLLAGFSAQAGPKFGLKAGVNIAKASFDTDVFESDNLTGFQVGPMVEFTVPIVGIGFDAAVMYSQQGIKFKEEGEKEKTERMSTIFVPVNFKYKFSLVALGAYLTAGPYVSFNLSDGFKGVKNEFETETFGAGLNFGLGIELLSKLQVGANYQLGLTNDYSAISSLGDVTDAVKKEEGKQRGWTISAAYFF